MNRKSIIIVLIFTVLFLGSAAFTYARGPEGGGPGRGHLKARGREGEMNDGTKGPGIRNIDACLGALDLTSEQIEKLKKIRDGHLEEMTQIRKDMHNIRMNKAKFIRQSDEIDSNQAEALIEEGSELRKQMERSRLNYRGQITQMLTKEQKDKLYMCENFGKRPKWDKQPPRAPKMPPLPPYPMEPAEE